jgi:hypothetical protein
MTLNKPHIPRKLIPCTWIKDKTKYFHFDSYEPYLVLYTMAHRNYLEDPHGETGSLTPIPNFQEPKEWVSLMHQTAGYACHSYYIHAKFLKPKTNIKEQLYPELLEKYNDSCIARVAALKTVNEYESILNKYKLSANRSYEFLEEGFYPIDIDCLNNATSERLPKNLQLLVKVKKNDKKLWSMLNYVHFGLAILGPNCD